MTVKLHCRLSVKLCRYLPVKQNSAAVGGIASSLYGQPAVQH